MSKRPGQSFPSLPVRGKQGAEAGMPHCHVYAHLSLCETPFSVFLAWALPLLVSTSSLLSRCPRERREGAKRVHHRPGPAPCHPSPAVQAHWAPWARTAVGPVDTNPGEPRPPSPGHSCSVSAREGMLRTSVFPEAASGCHQYIYSKRGRMFPEPGGKRRLQLKLITEQQSFSLPSLQLRNLGQIVT